MSNSSEVLDILEFTVKEMVENWRFQARVQPWVYGLLVALYACMIIVGATGNILVILIVIRNRAMRTARNVYIVNLAVSDLMLCLITMPLTLIEILYMTWQFGDYPLACPVAALLQATSIFVSTLSITAIALDRRKLIVYPHEPPPSGTLIMTTVPVIWGSAFAMASPLAIWKTLENWTEFPAELMNVVSGKNISNEENCTDLMDSQDYEVVQSDEFINCKLVHEIFPKWLNELQSCKEDFPAYGRLVYSVSSMVIQYLLPTLTISIAYYQIYGQLKMRLKQKMRQLEISATPAANGGPARCNGANANLIDRIENDIHRMRRTIHLLISMGLVFCVCWLPLNILNMVLDLTEEQRKNSNGKISEQTLCIIYAICHVMGMLSACANPIIYGFLNENFHREFTELYKQLKEFFCCQENASEQGQNQQNIGQNGVELAPLVVKNGAPRVIDNPIQVMVPAVEQHHIKS